MQSTPNPYVNNVADMPPDMQFEIQNNIAGIGLLEKGTLQLVDSNHTRRLFDNLAAMGIDTTCEFVTCFVRYLGVDCGVEVGVMPNANNIRHGIASNSDNPNQQQQQHVNGWYITTLVSTSGQQQSNSEQQIIRVKVYFIFIEDEFEPATGPIHVYKITQAPDKTGAVYLDTRPTNPHDIILLPTTPILEQIKALGSAEPYSQLGV